MDTLRLGMTLQWSTDGNRSLEERTGFQKDRVGKLKPAGDIVLSHISLPQINHRIFHRVSAPLSLATQSENTCVTMGGVNIVRVSSLN